MEYDYNTPYERINSSDYTGTVNNTIYVKYNPLDLNEAINSLVPPHGTIPSRGIIPSNISTADVEDIRRGAMMRDYYENNSSLWADVDNFKQSIKYLKDIKTNKIYKITIEEASLDDLNNELEAWGFKQV